MTTEIFNRKELKYVITDAQKQSIEQELEKHMDADRHNLNGELYRIFNLYIDTDDHQLIRTSLSKPKYKEKIRIRSYYEFKNDEIVFLEVKKRLGKHTNKRRTKIKYQDALKFIETGQKPHHEKYMNQQVMDEFEYTLSQNQYLPKTFITYDRLAYQAKRHADLRITFDTNLKTRRFSSETAKNLLPKNTWILEVKSATNMPLWLTAALTKHKIYKRSYSKYGNEYKQYLSEVEV